MATVDLTPQLAIATPTSWVNPDAALSSDLVYATNVASSTSVLKLKQFTQGLPKDISITGIEVISGVKLGSASAGTFLNIAFSYNGLTVVSTTKTSTALTTSHVSYHLGGASDLWGLEEIRRPKINPNQDFTIHLWSSGAGISLEVDSVVVRVHYTARTYLGGERSVFPDEFDTVEKKQNGIGPAERIRAEDVNKLGDCLYAIQSHVLTGSQNLVRGIGFPPGVTTILYTATVTGTVSGVDGAVYFNAGRRAGWSTTELYDNLTSPQGSQPPLFNAKCEFVSAFGWVQTASGLIPLHVTPRAYYSRKLPAGRNPGEEDVSFSFGFVAIPQTIYDSLTVQSNQNYKGIYFDPASVPNGTLVVKLMAIGLVIPN